MKHQQPIKRRRSFLSLLLIFALGVACGMWRAEILEQVAKGVEIARGW